MRMLGDQLVCTACLGRASVDASQAWSSLKARQEAYRHQSLQAAAGIPPTFFAESFETFRASNEKAGKLVTVLRNYCGNFQVARFKRTGFIFIGLPGTAKTHLACSMVQALVAQGISAVYTSLPRLTREIRNAYGKPRGVEQIIKSLVEADFLVLDEIDLHGTSDNDYSTLYDIINARYEQPGFPTLAISNRPLERLNRDLDERVVSRILAGTEPIIFDWEGQRNVRGPRESAKGESR
ncbi:ATP-binding protein [Paucibacter soli]|uniref:ATP-binding protein n=1 Tax=Paucibacter soli TaxID=3133433 RepID=UPI00309708E0